MWREIYECLRQADRSTNGASRQRNEQHKTAAVVCEFDFAHNIHGRLFISCITVQAGSRIGSRA